MADGVWLIRGGVPRIMNVYLIEEDGGVVVFDSGSKDMAKAITEAARPLGGINRVVLGHGHTDHRGSAPRLDAPVFCHPDEVEDAEGSGGFRYWGNIRKSNLPSSARLLHPLLHKYAGTAARWTSPRRCRRAMTWPASGWCTRRATPPG